MLSCYTLFFLFHNWLTTRWIHFRSVDLQFEVLSNAIRFLHSTSIPDLTTFNILRHGSNHFHRWPHPTIHQGLNPIGQKMLQAWPKRVPEDRHCNCCGIRYHGIHRLLRQAHPYPYQQHHCGCLNILTVLREPKSFTNLITGTFND